jgi:beta-glucosidase
MPENGPTSPGGSGRGRDIAALVAAMTIEEKAAFTVGVGNWHTASLDRLGVPPVKFTDGPNGARGMTGEDHLSLTTSLSTPTGSALGATWDPQLVGRVSAVVARQALEKGARVLLAPTVNLHRHPLWGRNFESFSEDPYLCGALAAAYIQGVQAEQVVATVKHFVCNETEHERRMCSSEVDERTLREMYLLPFEIAVRQAGVKAVMTSYNRVNGRYVPDDERLVGALLREEWGFGGIVMTDWNALAQTEEAGRAGLDLEMPGPGRAFGAPLAQAVKQGRVSEADLDAKVSRLLATFDSVGALDDPGDRPEQPEDRSEDRLLLRQAAADAMVLLSNDGLLPLSGGGLRRVALIGPGARRLAIMGGGSARVRPHYQLSLPQALQERFGPDVELVVVRGCSMPEGGHSNFAAPWPAVKGDESGRSPAAGQESVPTDQVLMAEAVEAAAAADVAIVVVGTDERWESESYDRLDMALPGSQAQLVKEVALANRRTVVAFNTGAPVDVRCAQEAAAVLQVWFGGQELANALADVLLGESEPGGRLPLTLPQRLEDTPAYGNFPAESGKVLYGERGLVGYRWYDARRLPVAFPFGHGLSYTDIRLQAARLGSGHLVRGGRLSLSVDLENVGGRAGSQVVQVYIAPPGGGCPHPAHPLRPVKQLKAFGKARLAPGEKTTLQVDLPERAFAFYDAGDEAWPGIMARYNGHDPDRSTPALHRAKAGWYVATGRYRVMVGTSSADMAFSLDVDVEGGAEPLPGDAPVV